MELIYALMTVIFASLFVLRQVQYNRVKKFNAKLEYELNAVRSQQDQQSEAVDQENKELGKKPIDTLTGLPSREAFDDRLTQAMLHSKRYQNPVALITLNVDHFHLINQKGYEVGDEVLKQLATRLRNCVRQVDTVTRYAGNNFLILLPQVAKAETTADIIKRIQDSIIPPFKINDRDYYITVSCGIAIAPTDGDTPEVLLHNATMALQLAHAKGRNTYQFFRADIQRMSERDTAISKYLQGKELFNNLEINYIPHVDIIENKVVHIHAQAFIDIPVYNVIPASEFMHLAEKVGVATEICQWEINTCITQIQAWRSQASIQPNVIIIDSTLKQIENSDFISKIASTVQTQDPNMQLVLEVNEDYFVGNQSISLQAIALLKAHKIKLAFNFYTFGQFALQKITNLPIKYLKINVNQLEGQEELLEFILQALHSSDIQVVAVGVDREDQKRRLQKIGFTIMTGVFFYRMIANRTPQANKTVKWF